MVSLACKCRLYWAWEFGAAGMPRKFIESSQALLPRPNTLAVSIPEEKRARLRGAEKKERRVSTCAQQMQSAIQATLIDDWEIAGIRPGDVVVRRALR
ncbi:hypothetical protein KM043_001125 [Ampulex compressa]|nr:hypothetical protein KM043_001125 [Ampulex compressa]